MKTEPRFRPGLLLLWIGLICGGGCGEDPAAPYGYTDDLPPAIPESGGRVLEGAEEENLAMRLTREASAPDGEGTNEDWVQRKVESVDQDVLFPRWEAHRRAAGKYEVSFTYTQVGAGESVARGGFAWTADVVLLLVSPPREMHPDELMPRASRVYQRRGLDRQRIELIEE
ncbi:MAG: hypothetical protein KJ726_05535 [Verrucomicrobia bacterium]|nr:hypothetical protein [Verrucomicrobiota bacterium]